MKRHERHDPWCRTGSLQATRLDTRLHYKQLDSIRGIAASIVVIHHTLILTIIGNGIWHQHVHPHGWWQWLLFRSPLILLQQGISAVYLFFVLSGFVLALPWIGNKPQAYPTFLVRRFFRIYVPYAASMALSVALFWIIGHPAVPDLSAWYAAMWHRPIDHRVLADMVVVSTRDAFVNYPTWTIAWELRVSLIFPLLLWPLTRLGRSGLVVSFVGLLVVSFALRCFGPDAAEFGRTMLAYSTLFLFGATLTSLVTVLKAYRAGSAILTNVLLVMGLLMLCPVWSNRPLTAFLPIGIGSLLVIAASLRTGWLERALQAPVPMWLGRVSFSLYLIHVPIFAAVLGLTHSVLPAWLSIALGVALSFTLAPIFNRLVERPSQHFGRRLTRTRTRADQGASSPVSYG